ncbi:MAG TPA: type II toxin-antitoxin system PemK/MazF family toxin [Pyrinomonadaceae bacterium]|nr:type II toxin-antitoxin system PemK/MazF family toxin [Pyrinomonadaceae bacterium]HMP65302.1 type II toxin-antitoxin system PemK/MazF family toxin [Pyrinomonadaceae bacterium]
MTPKRGDIYLVNFDPTVGAEIRKTRPAVVIQNDIANRYSPITIVAAMTTKFDDELYPTEVMVAASRSGLRQDSVILLNQIRSIDKARLVKRVGRVDETTLKRIRRGLQISLGLIEF